MDNQVNQHQQNPHDARPPRAPKKVRGEKNREKRIAELTQIAQTLDPYKGPSKQESKILKKYGITDYADPFLLTNQVLLLLEDSIENTSYGQ